ncbi:MAG: hypothetical protein VKJ04_01345 [Vampirovibrionales bacterium]|nr:hypothetical protein [Vampirovibrionales bacterium]
MSPRIANKDRAELPKPQVQIGVLGFSPLNALNLSYRYQGVGDALLAIPEESGNETAMQAKTVFQVLPCQGQADKASKAETFDLGSACFRCLSDALYRGKLPQVMLLSPGIAQMNAWLNEMMDYVEKTLQFGFFLRQNPVDNLFPNLVFISDGVYFARLMKSFDSSLQKFSVLTPEWRRQILAKCHRAVLLEGEKLESFDMAEIQSAEVKSGQSTGIIRLLRPPMKLRLASGPSVKSDGRPGGLSPHLDVIESVLALHGFSVEIENSVPNAAERLELEYALTRSSRVLLPALATVSNHNETGAKPSKKSITPTQTQTLQEQVARGIIHIGQRLFAFGKNEFSDSPKIFTDIEITPKPAATSGKTGASKPDRKTTAGKTTGADLPNGQALTLSPQDLTILDSLCHYALDLELPEERELFTRLDQKLKAQYFSETAQ